jgi:hypothetical protein
MTSCEKLKDATTVEKTFTMTIPPTDFTYTDTTTVKSSGMKLIYSKMMFFNIEDSLKKYNLTGSMEITGVTPNILQVESGDDTDLTWADLLLAKASNNEGIEGKTFGFGVQAFGTPKSLAFIFTQTGDPNSEWAKIMNAEQPLAFETMKSFPYFLQIYARTSGTVTKPKTVNLKIYGKFTIKANVSL